MTDRVEAIEQSANEFFAQQSLTAERMGVNLSASRMIEAYESHQLIGAALDDAELPMAIRKYARNCQDQFKNDVGASEYLFASARGTGSMYGDYQGKLCIPYRHHLKIDPAMAYVGAQLTGDCVSWAKRTARDQARCFDIDAKGANYEYVLRSATADLYSMRGHTGQGASPSRIAAAATKIGILLEAPATAPDGKVWDFSDYRKYYRWGMDYGRTGLPKWIFDLNRDKGPKQVAVVKTETELLTALWNGCGVSVGSMIGVSKTGGKDRVAFVSSLSGSWAHDMAIVGFDDRKKYHRSTLVIWDQSWGNWQSRDLVRAWPADFGPQPEGAFVLTLADTMKAVRGGECHALSDSIGFRPRRQATLGAEGLI